MAKINQIENALKELDGAVFQKLADSYLLKKGYLQINPIGSVAGSNKVKKGTPDTLIPTDDGRYVFAEYTTTDQIKVFGKLADDINNCLNENKTGIEKKKIKEIVLCYTSDLSPEEIDRLMGLCEESKVNLNLFGLGSISYDLLEKYPGIAKDYLGIEIDTGQIVALDDFITLYERNKLATTLQTKLHFREDEKKELNSLIQANSVVIIAGQAGVGKSRIAIESYRQFINENNNYKAYCIFNKGIDLFDDVKSYFSDAGDYLIFVDDANRISGFQYIVQQLQTMRSDQKLKVIVTVRDYALDKIRENCQSVSDVAEITINQLADKEIKKLLQDEFEINNHLYLNRIVDIAIGNPRIAVMAAQVAKDSNTLESIRDVSELYDKYYSSIKSDLEALGDDSILKVSGIVAFFRSIDKTDEEFISTIERIFGISSEECWEAAKKLHEMEVFDMFENEVVKVSDQVLSTYLFYLVFFKKKLINFSIMLTDLFPQYKQRLIDAINPVINAFDYEEVKKVLEVKVDRAWSLMKSGNENDFLQLIDVFWFLKPTDTLIYIRDKIDSISGEPIKIDEIKFEANSNSSSLPAYLTTLSLFRYLEEEQIKISLELFLQYAEKKPYDTPAILHYLVDRYGFVPDSYRYDYHVQHAVVDKLLERIGSGNNEYMTRLFIALAENYLHTHFSSTQSGRGYTITITQFDLLDTEGLSVLRGQIIKQLIKLYGGGEYQEHILRMILSYARPSHHLTVGSIVENDSKLILPFIRNALDPGNIFHCIVVQQYYKQLKRLKIKTDESLKLKYQSKEYVFYDFLTNRSERAELKLSHEEYRDYKNKVISKLTSSYSEDDYIKTLSWMLEVSRLLDGHFNWQIHQGAISVLDNLLERDTELFIAVLVRYLEQGEYLEINPWMLMSHMLLKCDVASVFDIVNTLDYPTKNTWLFSYYQHLPSDKISQEDLSALSELYRRSDYKHFAYDFDFLMKYEVLQKGFVTDIVEILIDRARRDSGYARLLDMLFNTHTEVNKNINTVFIGKFALLEEAYLLVDRVGSHLDYDGSTLAVLLDNDQSFIARYLKDKISGKDYFYRHEDNRDYSFIWLREDCHSIMEQITSIVYECENKGHCFGYYESFFNRSVKPQSDALIIDKQNKYLIEEIETHNEDSDYMRFIFSVIVGFLQERRVLFYKVFLDKNKDFDDFEKLPYEPSISTWSGSAVPMLQNKIRFYEKVRQLCDSVDLLKHKQYMELFIKRTRNQINREKKKDFTEAT